MKKRDKKKNQRNTFNITNYINITNYSPKSTDSDCTKCYKTFMRKQKAETDQLITKRRKLSHELASMKEQMQQLQATTTSMATTLMSTKE